MSRPPEDKVVSLAEYDSVLTNIKEAEKYTLGPGKVQQIFLIFVSPLLSSKNVLGSLLTFRRNINSIIRVGPIDENILEQEAFLELTEASGTNGSRGS